MTKRIKSGIINIDKGKGMIIMTDTIVTYTNTKGGLVEVVSINGEEVEEVLYFDFEDFVTNISDLVELYTNSRNCILQKI